MASIWQAGFEALLDAFDAHGLGVLLDILIRDHSNNEKSLDDVLRSMRRRYTTATFLRRLEPLADLNLTTDVIVGFPAEDEAAFERTLAVVGQAGITKVHVFPYSPRPGTTTAAEDTVPAAVKKERSARLRAPVE